MSKTPLVELFTPPCKAFSAPFYALYEDIPTTSLYGEKNVNKIDIKNQSRQICEKLLRSIVRIGVTSAVFYAYDKTWSYGNYYFGVAGGLMGFVVCYLLYMPSIPNQMTWADQSGFCSEERSLFFKPLGTAARRYFVWF